MIRHHEILSRGSVAFGEYLTRTMLSSQTVSFIIPGAFTNTTPSESW